MRQTLRQNLDGIIDWAIRTIRENPQQHQAVMDETNLLVREKLGPLAKQLGIQL